MARQPAEKPAQAAGPGDGQARPARVRRWNTTTKVVIVVFLIALALLSLYLFRVVVVPLIIGTILAYVLTPGVQALSRRLRVPHGAATAIVYLALLAVVLPLPAVLVPWIVRQAIFLQREAINFFRYLDTISTDTIEVLGFELLVGDLVDRATSAITDLIASAAPASLTLVFDAAEVLLLVIFTFLIAFYLTRDADKVRAWFKGLVPLEYREDVHRLAAEIDAIWSAFLRGQLTLALVVAGLLSAGAAILGLSQPLLLGVLGGLLEFLPSVGHAVWLITASILALVEGSSTLPVSNFVFLLIVIGFHTAYTQFDLNFLIPRIIGGQVHLHPMIVILGIIVGATAGSLIGGVVGSVLGIALAAPTIASLRVIGRYVYARLLDLDPFPMVGPPVSPPAERLEMMEEVSQREGPKVFPAAARAIERLRGKRAKEKSAEAAQQEARARRQP